MGQQEQPPDDEHLRQLVHDVQHCLHVIGIATHILKSVRDDAERFAEVCDSIDKERREAMDLVKEFLTANEQRIEK